MTTHTLFLDRHQRLGDLVANYPLLAAFFSEIGIDFCCGGNRSLIAAVEEQGLEYETFVDQVLVFYKKVRQGRDGTGHVWADGQLAELIDHIIKRFHEGHRIVFPGIEKMMAKVLSVYESRFPFLPEMEILLKNLWDHLVPHMAKEENVLFPLAKKLANGQPGPMDLRRPVEVMRHEHEEAGDLIRRITRLTHQFTPPTDTCTTFSGLYSSVSNLTREIHMHVHLENNVLFPMIERYVIGFDKQSPTAGNVQN